MGLGHLIAESFREIAEGSTTLNEDLPGGIYYGARGEVDNPVYPLALLQVREHSREYNSGGGALVDYEVMLTVFSKQAQTYPGEITKHFASYFHTRRIFFPTIPPDTGRLIGMRLEAGTLEEDPDEELGRNAERASITWNVTLSEREEILDSVIKRG